MKFTPIFFGPKHFWIISKMTSYHFGTWDFGKSHFGTYVSLWEYFSTCTVWPCRCSSRWTFQHRNILAWGLFGTGNFCFRNFWHHRHFRIFGHLNISKHGFLAPCKAIWTKILHAKKSPCRNIPILKSAGTSTAPNGTHAKIFPWCRNDSFQNLCLFVTEATQYCVTAGSTLI